MDDDETPVEMAERLLMEAEAERMRKMAKEKPPAVPRDDLHPKVKAGAITYIGILLAGAIAALTKAQSTLELSPMAALGITGALTLLPILASYFKAGDGK